MSTRTPELFFLPKIHKGKLPPPGRPICSSNDGPTEKTSAFLDFFLNRLVKCTNSYIKDAGDCVIKIALYSSIMPKPGSVIGSLDVSSFYTTIPNEGIEATLDAYVSAEGIDVKPSAAALGTLLNFVLKCNIFQFNGTNYLKVGGTAMGTRVVPTYANHFMACLEAALLESSPYWLQVWKGTLTIYSSYGNMVRKC